MSKLLDTAFYLVLNMSITASVIGLLLMGLRQVKQMPRFCMYALWGLVFIRLMIPFAFSSEMSLLNYAGGLIKKVVAVPVQDSMSLTMANTLGAANSYFPVTYRTDLLKAVFSTAALVWAIGAVVAVLLIILLYCLNGRELRKATHFKDNIYISRTVLSPMVFGMFRQRIIIPSGLAENEAELKYVLLHEQVHSKRHDNVYRFVAVLIACLHWFNPLVWGCLRLFFRDMEFACDAKAVELLPMEERSSYARTLVNFSAGQKVFLSAAFGEANVKARVLNVLNYKKLTALGMFYSVLFFMAIALVLLTNPIK